MKPWVGVVLISFAVPGVAQTADRQAALAALLPKLKTATAVPVSFTTRHFGQAAGWAFAVVTVKPVRGDGDTALGIGLMRKSGKKWTVLDWDLGTAELDESMRDIMRKNPKAPRSIFNVKKGVWK